MGKQKIFSIIAGMLVLSACSPAAQSGTTQAQIDSMANAKTAEMQVQKAARNDSIINAMAQRRADSIEASQKATQSAATKATLVPGKINAATNPAGATGKDSLKSRRDTNVHK